MRSPAAPSLTRFSSSPAQAGSKRSNCVASTKIIEHASIVIPSVGPTVNSHRNPLPDRRRGWIRKVVASNLIISLACLWCSAASATVDFVQITDPHIFDSTDEAAGNKEALKWCINQIHARVEAKADYKFIVVTGDLGLQDVADGPEKKPNAVTEAAKQLAEIIKDSKVQRWLFLPGNNDLRKGEDPAKIETFHNFPSKLFRNSCRGCR